MYICALGGVCMPSKRPPASVPSPAVSTPSKKSAVLKKKPTLFTWKGDIPVSGVNKQVMLGYIREPVDRNKMNMTSEEDDGVSPEVLQIVGETTKWECVGYDGDGPFLWFSGYFTGKPSNRPLPADANVDISYAGEDRILLRKTGCRTLEFQKIGVKMKTEMLFVLERALALL